MKKSFSLLLFFLFLLVVTPLSSALTVPSWQKNFLGTNAKGYVQGLDIEGPIIEEIKGPQNHEFNIHVHNVSSGLILSNETVRCWTHLYNMSGYHIWAGEMDFGVTSFDFYKDFAPLNFSQYTQYHIVFYCQAYDDPGEQGTPYVGGFFAYGFYATPTGEVQQSFLDNPILLILLVLGILLLIAGISFHIPSLGFLASILFLFAGLYGLIYGLNDVNNLYTKAVSVTIIGISIVFMITSAYEWAMEGREG